MKKYIILLLFVLPIAGNTNAQDTTFTNEYLELVRTYKNLDEVYQVHPEFKPEPPKIVITDDEVLFYGDGSDVVNTMPVMREEPIPFDDPKYGEYIGKNIIRIYGILDDELLFLREVYGEWEGHTKPKSNSIFDAQGNFITSIKKWHTTAQLSPNKNYFITYNAMKDDTLQIYKKNGELISNKVAYESDTDIFFSLNSKSIILHNWLSGYIKVKDLFGRGTLHLNYHETIKKPINSIFVFEEIQRVLLSNYNESFFLNYNTDQIWSLSTQYIILCEVYNKYLALATKKVLDTNSYICSIHFVDLTSGTIVFESYCDEVLAFAEDYIIIKNNDKYNEYKIY